MPVHNEPYNSSSYNTIGQRYSDTRRPDSRIVEAILRLLALPRRSQIADIGAGTGNYSNALADRGFRVHAVEPSSVMRDQATPHPQVQWLAGVAEALPLRDGQADAVVSTLAIHHFSDLRRSMREMGRVAGTGPLVLFTFDYSVIERPWQADYFPSLWEEMARPLPPLEEIAEWIGEDTRRLVEVVPFALPADLTDLFMLAPWRRPHLYLDARVRGGISTFAMADEKDVEAGLERLREELGNGKWDAKHGWVREREEFDAGYRFVCARKYGVNHETNPRS